MFTFDVYFRCATPDSVKGQQLFQVDRDVFSCPNPHHHAIKTSLLISLGVICSLLFLTGGAIALHLLVIRGRRRKMNQPYYKVTANGGIHM